LPSRATAAHQDVDDLTVYANIDPRRVHTVHDLIAFGPA
jgi:hypothetical protein